MFRIVEGAKTSSTKEIVGEDRIRQDVLRSLRHAGVYRRRFCLVVIRRHFAFWAAAVAGSAESRRWIADTANRHWNRSFSIEHGFDGVVRTRSGRALVIATGGEMVSSFTMTLGWTLSFTRISGLSFQKLNSTAEGDGLSADGLSFQKLNL